MPGNIDWRNKRVFRMANNLNPTIKSCYLTYHANYRLNERFATNDMPSQPTETVQFPIIGGHIGYMSRDGDICIIWATFWGYPAIITVMRVDRQYRNCRGIALANERNLKISVVTRDGVKLDNRNSKSKQLGIIQVEKPKKLSPISFVKCA